MSYVKPIQIIAMFLAFILGASGCTETERVKPEERKITNFDEMASVYEQINNLDKLDDIEKIVVYVENIPISKREIETKKLYLTNPTTKGAIDALIWKNAAKAEAEKLNIYPLQEKIEAYMQQYKELYTTDELTKKTVDSSTQASGISLDEYWETSEKSIYDIYQRDALWESVSQSQGLTDPDKYFDELMKNAKVEFKDEETEKAYFSGE